MPLRQRVDNFVEVSVRHRGRDERVLVATDFFSALAPNKIRWLDRDEYPTVVTAAGRVLGTLHGLAWEFSRGCAVPGGHHVHHLEGKRDARPDRLELLSHKAHAMVHSRERGTRSTTQAAKLRVHLRSDAPASRRFPVQRAATQSERIALHLQPMLPDLIELFAPSEVLENRIPPARVSERLAATADEPALGLLASAVVFPVPRPPIRQFRPSANSSSVPARKPPVMRSPSSA